MQETWECHWVSCFCGFSIRRLTSLLVVPADVEALSLAFFLYCAKPEVIFKVLSRLLPWIFSTGGAGITMFPISEVFRSRL